MWGISESIINKQVKHMKVIQVQQHKSIFDTRVPPLSGLKKIQNYVFDLGNVIGAGNFSKVYRGINQLNNQVCAIKVVEMERMKTPALIKLLESECEVLKTLKHPNILNCIEIFTSKNHCYIVTEMCNQGDLESLIRKNGPLDEKQAKKIIYEIFLGLKYLNDMKIIHRDFKVANIFMKDGVAKIADFGFASKLKHDNEVFMDINIGSPIYMSPEGLLNHIYGAKTDIWAFGVFLFEILHGDTPLYFCKSENDLKANIGVPIKESAISSRISPGLKNLIMKCLEIDERKRISVPEMCSHPYIQQLKYAFEGRSHSLTLKASESTTSQSSVQIVEAVHNRQLSSKLGLQTQHIVLPTASITSVQNYESMSPPKAVRRTLKLEESQETPPQLFLKHKISATSDPRVSVRSHSVDNLGTYMHNALNVKVVPPVRQQSNIRFNKSLKTADDVIISVSSSKEVTPSNIIFGSISFAQCVHLLHYCRLVYKCVSLALKENCYLECNTYLSNWLLGIIKEISNKQAEVRFDGDRASERKKKLKDVISEYNSKYMKQLQQYISVNPILSPNVMKVKIQEQIRVICQILEGQSIKNKQMMRLAHSLDFLRDSTSALCQSLERQDLGRFGQMKIEDFLANKAELTAINLASIKANSLM